MNSLYFQGVYFLTFETIFNDKVAIFNFNSVTYVFIVANKKIKNGYIVQNRTFYEKDVSRINSHGAFCAYV